MIQVVRKGKKPVKGQTKRTNPEPVRAMILNGPRKGQISEVIGEYEAEELSLFSSPEERRAAEMLLDRITESLRSAASYGRNSEDTEALQTVSTS